METKIAFSIFLMGAMGLILIDLSSYANALTNGFWTISASQAFHIGFFLSLASLIVLFWLHLD